MISNPPLFLFLLRCFEVYLYFVLCCLYDQLSCVVKLCFCNQDYYVLHLKQVNHCERKHFACECMRDTDTIIQVPKQDVGMKVPKSTETRCRDSIITKLNIHSPMHPLSNFGSLIGCRNTQI